MKIKLVFFHPYSKLGGADKSLYKLISSLDPKKFDITFISIGKIEIKDLFNKKNNINFISLKSKRTLFTIFQIRKILKEITQKKFEKYFFISNQNFANVLAYFIMSNIKFFKVILIERNHLDELKFYKNINDFIKKKIISFLMSITYKKADAVIGISQCLSNDLSKKIKKKVITIYSPAYDKKIFKLSDKKKPNIFNNKNKKYIINVSRFSKRKDQLTLLKAFSLIKDKIENLNLIMLGYGEEINNLKKYVQENNLEKKVYFIDKTLNPYPYIKNSDLFVLTSHYEGFPNVLVESLALRTPVISTNCNAGPKEILLNGKGGILININDHLNLSKKILSFFKNKNSLLKKMNYAIKKLYRFERKQHVVKYENLFNKL